MAVALSLDNDELIAIKKKNGGENCIAVTFPEYLSS